MSGGTALFQVRGTQYDAYYAKGSPTHQKCLFDGTAAISIASQASAYGTSNNVIRLSSTWASLVWEGGRNAAFTSGSFTIEATIVPQWTGTPGGAGGPGGDILICGFSGDNYWSGGLRLIWESAGKFRAYSTKADANPNWNFQSTTTYSGTSGTPFRIALTWDGTTGANKVIMYLNGVSDATATASAAAQSPVRQMRSVFFGGTAVNQGYPYGKVDLSQLLIYDGVDTLVTDTPTNFAALGTLDGSSNTSPGVGNVRNATTWNLNGVQQTGTATIPSLANTATGVAGDGGTGTFDGSTRWTDPGESNVLTGIAYKANSTTNNKTGTLPASADINEMITKVDELHALAGLTSGTPCTTTTTRRTAGSIVVTLTGDGTSSTTATRTA